MLSETKTKKLALIIDFIEDEKLIAFTQKLTENGFELSLLQKNNARNSLLEKFKNLVLSNEEITHESVRDLEPEFDLIIKVGGNSKSLEDSVIIGASYAEIYFADMDAADFDLTELEKALADFEIRKRNFGI